MINIILIVISSICVYILGWAAWILIGVLNDYWCQKHDTIEDKQKRFETILIDLPIEYMIFGLLSWLGVSLWLIYFIIYSLFSSAVYIALFVGKLFCRH